MLALICNDFTGVDSLTYGEMPEPQMTPGSVLVDVASAAVGFADSLVISGQHQMKHELPCVPGTEVAGTVIDSGDVAKLSAGDRVCGFVHSGAFAERVAITASAVVKLPESISFDVGAAIPVSYGTSYHALIDRGGLQKDETLLVLGAAGGVGLAAVQIGKVIGARVLAAVSSEEKAETVLKSGADHVIRYDETSLRDGIAEATGGAGVDVVYDPVGGVATEQALRSTKWGGRLLVVGFAAGEIPSIPINLTLVKGNAIVGVFWGRDFLENPEQEEANLATIVKWVEADKLKPFVQKIFPLEDGAEAIRWVADRKAIGRVLVKP